MGKFNDAKKIGIRDIETDKIIAVYPYKAEGSDEGIEKAVRDWYYKQSCQAEEKLFTSYVDIIDENEAK